jgi:hypothetical protein
MNADEDSTPEQIQAFMAGAARRTIVHGVVSRWGGSDVATLLLMILKALEADIPSELADTLYQWHHEPA